MSKLDGGSMRLNPEMHETKGEKSCYPWAIHMLWTRPLAACVTHVMSSVSILQSNKAMSQSNQSYPKVMQPN